MTVGNATEWAEDVFDEPWLAERGLTELGWTQRSIESFLAERSQLIEDALPKPEFAHRMKELLGSRRTVEDEVSHETVRVPLFRFAAPQVRGAMTQYSERDVRTEGGYWWLKVFGIGTANSQELTYSADRTYVAEDGQCKQVFVPVRIRVARVRVIEDGVEVGRGIRASVVVPKAKTQSVVRARGVRNMSPGHCSAPDSSPEETLDYQLAGDAGNPHRVQHAWATDVVREISLRLKDKVEIGPVVRVSRRRMMVVDLTLPPGHDYLGHRGVGRLWWETP